MITAESQRDCGEKPAKAGSPNYGLPEIGEGLIALDIRVATPGRWEELPSGSEEGWRLVDFGELLLAVRAVIPRDKKQDPTDQQTIKPKSGDRPSKLKVDEQSSKAKAREDPRYLTRDDVCEMLGVSKRHSYRLMADRRAPKPFRVGTAIRWKRDELVRWIETRRGR